MSEFAVNRRTCQKVEHRTSRRSQCWTYKYLTI